MHLETEEPNIYFIGQESEDVTWTKIDRLTKRRKPKSILKAAESAVEPFVYVLTEALEPHHGWFRFVLTVNPGDAWERRYQFVIPCLRIPRGQDYMTAKPVYESRSTSDPRFYQTYRWEPNASLLPAPVERTE